MKRIFVLVAIVFATVSVNAQHISLGPTAGFGHSWLRTDDLGDGVNRDFHASYNVGLKLVYSIVEHWGVSADVKYSSEGGNFSADDDPDDGKLKWNANYIRVPIQAVYFFGNLGDAVRPKISVGPSFGFLMGGKLKTESNGETVSELDTKDYFSSFDFGGTVSFGANFKLAGDKWLNADLGYTHGFSNVLDNGSDGKVKNSGLLLNVGLLFPIGGKK